MRRVDGHKFQQEFFNFFILSCYVKRLYTPSTKFSGLTQPADFFLSRNGTHLIELKETGADTLSLANIDQRAEIEGYVKWSETAPKTAVGYYLIAHFINRRVLRAITAQQVLQLIEKRQTLKYNGNVGWTFQNFKELDRGGLF